MAKRCELTGKGTKSGNNVSHAMNKTKRTFQVNVQNVSLKSDILDQSINLKIAASTLRSVDHNGGLDNFLLTAKAASLSENGAKLRRKIKKAQLAKESKAPKKAA